MIINCDNLQGMISATYNNNHHTIILWWLFLDFHLVMIWVVDFLLGRLSFCKEYVLHAFWRPNFLPTIVLFYMDALCSAVLCAMCICPISKWVVLMQFCCVKLNKLEVYCSHFQSYPHLTKIRWWRSCFVMFHCNCIFLRFRLRDM